MTTENDISYTITHNDEACLGCGICAAFCPMNVYDMQDGKPLISHPEQCVGCETCSGQCPVHCLTITAIKTFEPFLQTHETAAPLDEKSRETYRDWAQTLTSILGLRWKPVGVRLIKTGEPWPDVPLPTERLRYCQSLMAARRGRSFLMPVNRHACPDGTSILGLTDMAPKLASGELYLLFHKLDSEEAALRMVHERPALPPKSVEATCVFPLEDAPCDPEVIAIVANPEQMMWLSMATSYYTGHRHEFHASGYNAQCVEITLIPLLSGQINISLGCYGCRAASDVEDSMMMMGIPLPQMESVIRGVRELGKKAIPQSRDKIYVPPLQ